MKRLIVLASLCIALVLALVASPAMAFQNVTPAQANDLVINGSSGAFVSYDGTVYYILDVRTAEEWKWVGHPGKNKAGVGAGLEGKVANIAFMIDKKGAFILNPSFLTEVNEMFGSVKENVVLITMCRSGGRSEAAAAALEGAGYRAMNMLTGFQGGTDANGYRTKNGWVVDGLPYNNSTTGMYTD